MKSEEPRWKRILSRSQLVPFARVAWFRRELGVGLGLGDLWMLLLSFAVSLLTMPVVLSFIIRGSVTAEHVPLWLPIGLAATSLASLAGVLWARSQPMDTSSMAKLAYRAAFFMGTAFAQTAALFGFVAVFFVSQLWPYLVGLPVSLIGLALVAPTRRDLERRQQQITAAGSPLELREALTRGPQR